MTADFAQVNRVFATGLLLQACGTSLGPATARTWTLENKTDVALHAELEMSEDYGGRQESFDVAPQSTRHFTWEARGPDCSPVCGGSDYETSEWWRVTAEHQLEMGSGKGYHAIPERLTCDNTGCPARAILLSPDSSVSLTGDCAELRVSRNHETRLGAPPAGDQIDVAIGLSASSSSPPFARGVTATAVYAEPTCLTGTTEVVLKSGRNDVPLYVRRLAPQDSEELTRITMTALGYDQGTGVHMWR